MKLPVAAVISGVVFGIYHGNIVQGIYASILGTAFAWILEMSGNIYSSMLLHMGANIWSLLISEYALDLYSMKYGVQILILIYLILLISVVYCLTHFEKMCSIRKKKRIGKDSCQFCRVKNTKTAIPRGIAVFAVIDLNIYCFINFRPFCMYMFPG